MVRSFQIPDKEVGKWAGICAATFSLCQAMMGIPWGRASDTFGRKPAILLGLIITLTTTLVWGFSTNLWMALAARAVAGMGNGNVGIMRTTVAEMVPYKELQPRAFSLMPLVWNVGSILGPTIGGALANPLRVQPGERVSSGSVLQQYPYALPNIVSAVFFLIGIVVGTLYLKETLETKRDQRDYGLVVGQALVRGTKALMSGNWTLLQRQQLHRRSTSDSEHVAFLEPDERDTNPAPNKSSAPPPWRDVLNKQSLINLLAYTGLAMHNMAFDQVLPVYMSDKPPDPAAMRQNFFNYAGGFGLTNLQIGMLNTAYAIYGLFMQFLLFPPTARRLGVLYCMKVSTVVFPLAYILMPFTLLLPTQHTQVAACFALQLLKETCTLFAFPCSMILLTNTASSMRILGTLNGIATSTSAIGRAAGPALTGLMYTYGAKTGYLIMPWWFLAVVGIISALPVFFMVEGDGPASEEEADAGAELEQEELLVIEAVEGGAEAIGKPGPELLATSMVGNEQIRRRQ